MINIAIGVLWFLIGLVVLCGVIYLAIWVIESFVMPIPEPVKRGVWVVVLLLSLIALLTVIATGGISGLKGPFRMGWDSLAGRAVAALSCGTAAHLS